MSYRVEWSKGATKQLLKIPRKQRAMILAWVKRNLDGCDDPRAVHDAKRLQGSQEGWRWRVGSYRLMGRIEDESLIIEIVRVGHRQDAYGNLPKL